MKIHVKSLQGDEYILDVQEDQPVSELKAQIQSRANGLAINRQKLVFKGRTLQDSNYIKEYNLDDGCKVHLIVQKENPSSPQDALRPTSASLSSSSNTPNALADRACPMETTADRLGNFFNIDSEGSSSGSKKLSKFEILLKERLAAYFSQEAVEKIMANLEKEIIADINSSSLDDLERLAKQKLNISNE